MDQVLALILSFLLGFIPMLGFAAIIYWLDRYEKEPLLLLGGVFTWGAVIAAAGAFIFNTLTDAGLFLLVRSESLADFTTGFMVAPLVEESLKGFAILLIFWMFRSEFDSILDGIVYAAVTALGFAATENAFYIFNFGYLKGGWGNFWLLTFIRIIVVGWQHPFYTSFTGIGLAYARLHQNKTVKAVAPLLGLFASIFTHSFHNFLAGFGNNFLCIIGSIFDWSGWIAMLVFILLMVNREKSLMIQYLKEEIDLGNITLLQYTVIQSTGWQIKIFLESLFNGGFFRTRRFYQLCAELSHKKFQFASFGNEIENNTLIEALRSDLRELSPIITTQ
jgi:protease PrsW